MRNGWSTFSGTGAFILVLKVNENSMKSKNHNVETCSLTTSKHPSISPYIPFYQQIPPPYFSTRQCQLQNEFN